MINKDNFFKVVRATMFGNSLNQNQVNGMNAILDEWNTNHSNRNPKFLAYMLSTTYHETAKTMSPIEEYGKGSTRPYGKKIKCNRSTYTTPNQLYYGRGFVQLTWYENYEKFAKLLKVDLLNNPALALDLKIATKIMFEGMIKGLFTGAKLETFFTDTKTDWVNARKIINGTDKAELIAGYSVKFYNALLA